MLVSAKDMLNGAVKGHYAIAAFNTNNLEWTAAILDAAEAEQAPVIIQCTGGAAKWQTSFKVVKEIVDTMVKTKNITVPVAMHLDHGNYDEVFEAIDADFTSVMYDGSREHDFDLNLKRTEEIVKLCHKKGISVEAEVGGIGGTEDGVTNTGELADPAQCEMFANLNVDALACGIGNIHGVYPASWKSLSFEQIKLIKEKVGDLPLVLHGGSGIPTEQTQKAISMGIAKVNVNTELQQVFTAAIRKYVEEGKDLEPKGFDPRKILKPGREAIVERAVELIRTFGSDQKGWQ